ncbi:unnamed protein product [Didymodactylos carnosus]|uniref:Uncharacterized protein n=1 Tax=Didymodactylos carnosus TaxID=1234261 RepID=A0A814FS22_9BILA|nr:unnamed protein product [Didymodactylos carnosus]CAF3757326.1 unnamed protein product [Didymodactylos carnosus]
MAEGNREWKVPPAGYIPLTAEEIAKHPKYQPPTESPFRTAIVNVSGKEVEITYVPSWSVQSSFEEVLAEAGLQGRSDLALYAGEHQDEKIDDLTASFDDLVNLVPENKRSGPLQLTIK